MHLLIVEARFYDDLADAQAAGAIAEIERQGATYERITVPGALEIATAIRMAIDTGKYDGYVALGCVIRGETTHYQTVCEESARGLTWLGIEFQACIGNGILTVENEAQAWERADPAKGNKGAGAAAAALRLIDIKRSFGA